ncbi:uncharacterized protein LOC144104346 [Amblyomma americanum]
MVPSQNYAQSSVQENKSQKFKAPETKSPEVMNTNDGNKTTICIVCNRKVKNKNMNMHLDVCLRNSSATPVNSTWKAEHTSETPPQASAMPDIPIRVSAPTQESPSVYPPRESDMPRGLHDEDQTTPQDYAIPVITNHVSESAQEDPSVYQPGESDRQRDDVEMDSDPLGDSVNSSFEVIYKAEARDDSHSHEQRHTTPAFQDGNRDRGAASTGVVSQPSSAGPATCPPTSPPATIALTLWDWIKSCGLGEAAAPFQRN